MGPGADREHLGLCERLAGRGMRFALEPGMRVARGFADLGYEEFLLLPEGRLISLVNGAPGEIPSGHERHFFAVPGIDLVVDELARRGWRVEGAVFEHERRWRWRAVRGPRAAEGEDPVCEKALLKLALVVCEVGDVQTTA